jgi:hypothetical protein
MEDITSAKQVANYVKQLTYLNKVFNKIEKCGSADVGINAQGVHAIVKKDDAMYLYLKALEAGVKQKLGSYEIIKRAEALKNTLTEEPIPSPTPTEISPKSIFEEEAKRREEKKRELHRLRMRRFREKRRLQGIS